MVYLSGLLPVYFLTMTGLNTVMKRTVRMCRNLFEVFDSRDPHKSVMVISQFPVASWYDLFQEHTYAEACLSRLLHNAYRLEMNGKNMRNIEAINSK